jgi:hypothetical protein
MEQHAVSLSGMEPTHRLGYCVEPVSLPSQCGPRTTPR